MPKIPNSKKGICRKLSSNCFVCVFFVIFALGQLYVVVHTYVYSFGSAYLSVFLWMVNCAFHANLRFRAAIISFTSRITLQLIKAEKKPDFLQGMQGDYKR